MTRLETLQALKSRIEEAKGPNKALAREIMCSVGGWHRVAPRFMRGKHPGFIAPQDWIGEDSDGSPITDSLHGTDMHRDVPDVTSSLDAVVALIEREMPGCNASMGWGEPHLNPWASLAPLYADGRHALYAGGATHALALLSAFIAALIAKEPTHAD